MTSARVGCRVEDGLAIIEIENPPVNALARPVREGLLAAITACDADPAVRAVLIHGLGRHFVAGADILAAAP